MLQKKLEKGELTIVDEVITLITEMALTEIQDISIGSASMKEKIFEKVKKSNNSINVETNNGKIDIHVKVAIAFGKNIPKTIFELQKLIKEHVELFTGFTVNEVNVTVNQILFLHEKSV